LFFFIGGCHERGLVTFVIRGRLAHPSTYYATGHTHQEGAAQAQEEHQNHEEGYDFYVWLIDA
jgi:hypothetical protein